MLISNEMIKGIREGKISLIFRRWRRPGVKAGGTQMTQGGVVGIDSAEVIEEAAITEGDAGLAGFASLAALREHLNPPRPDTQLYRVRVHFAGEDPRIALRENADLSDSEVQEILGKLHKLDANAQRGPWTQQYLQIIQDRPATYSGVLARELGLEIPKFKPWVRKLKALGLTESLDVGYRLSPRGEKVLDALTRKHNP
ncbi:MAG TPA: hypothetical protein VNA17_01730 [Pyrinomonadaceae bacterium]|nr:hypothetical protein [Pyrinomonadaceae bacterium]